MRRPRRAWCPPAASASSAAARRRPPRPRRRAAARARPDPVRPERGSGGYLLTARQPGQFVALGVPLTEALRDVVVSASFHKVAGPAGGGFGLIVRDQGPDARDGQSQAGRYYVFEVGDKGEV